MAKSHEELALSVRFSEVSVAEEAPEKDEHIEQDDSKYEEETNVNEAESKSKLTSQRSTEVAETQMASVERKESDKKLKRFSSKSYGKLDLLPEMESKEKNVKSKSSLMKLARADDKTKGKAIKKTESIADSVDNESVLEEQSDGEPIDGEDENGSASDKEKKEEDHQRHKAQVKKRFPRIPSHLNTPKVNPSDEQEQTENQVFEFDGVNFYDNVEMSIYRHKHILEDHPLPYIEEFTNELDSEMEKNFSSFSTEEDSVEESTETESLPSIGIDTVQMKTDFLNNFELPNFSDISDEDHSILTKRYTNLMHPEISTMLDIGRFVHPLTGEALESSVSSDISSESEVTKVEEELVVTESSIVDFEDEEEFPMEPIKIFENDENQSEVFVNFQQALNVLGDDEDSSILDYSMINAKKESTQIINDFLEELLHDVLCKSEILNAHKRLRMQLDKMKLLAGLSDSIETYETERLLNEFLNNRVTEYYKRQRVMRVFITFDPKIEYRERLRYYAALNHLDYVKNRVAEAKRMNSNLMASVLMDLQYAQTIVKNTESHLVYIMRQYLIRNNSEYLKRIVEREIRAMAHKRNEISDARLFLITRKHSLGRIADKIIKLEKVSDNLYVNDFVAIQNQVVALDKKIEERSNDLKKMFHNYQVELHQIQHDREKALVLNDKLEKRKAILLKKQKRQWELRETLYNEKMQRTRLQQKQKELSMRGGILSMPALLFDYDVTLKKVEEKRVSVAKLKENLKALMSRVAYYETRNL